MNQKNYFFASIFGMTNFEKNDNWSSKFFIIFYFVFIVAQT
jgi:hypothetical protein